MRHTLPTLTALLALLSAPAFAGSTYLSGDRYHAMLPPDEPKPERAPGPRVVSRSLEIETLDEGLRVRVKWTLDTDRPGWFAGTLIGPQFHIESMKLGAKRLAAHADSNGRNLYGWIEGETEVEIVAVLPEWNEGAPVQLRLLRAARGAVWLDSDDFELGITADAAAEVDGVWWTGSEQLGLAFERPRGPVARNTRPLLTAQSGVGLTFLDGELVGRGRLSWQVLRGEVQEVVFSAAGVGADLEVTGGNVRSFARSGNRVVVQLQEPATGRIDVDVAWSQPLPRGTQANMAVPSLTPEAFRVDGSVQIARAGDQEVVPRVSGWQPRAGFELPSFGRGLIEGTPTAAFTGQGTVSGSLGLFTFEPVSGPPAVVDVAQYTLATSTEGRVLMRAHYEVRNERAQWLEVTPPPGLSILGARVGADTAFPVAGDRGMWRIPLLRSVETVEGLLTFPVEVAFIGEIPEWADKEERELALPTVNAEIAVSRVTLYLPPGYASQLDDNEGGSVPMFSEGEGIAYGFSVGETGAAQADALFQEAVSSWMENDFDKAQDALDDLRGLGGDNENVRRLQSNLDLVAGSYQGDADVATSRRIKDQAKARGLDDERRAVDLKRKAEEAQVTGDYGGSSAYYTEYIELTEKLQRLEQDESVEYKKAEEDARTKMAANASFEQSREEIAKVSTGKSRKKADRVETTTYDFESIEISGELVEPDGDGIAFGRDAYEEDEEVVEITANRITIDDLVNIPSGRSFQTVLEMDGEDVLDANAGEFADRDLLAEAVYGDDGIVGGVEGGVVGGALGGVAGATLEGRVESAEYAADATTVSETIALETVSRAPGVIGGRGGRGSGAEKGGGGSGGGRARTAKPAAAMAPPPPPPSARPAPPEEPEPMPEPMDEADYDDDYGEYERMDLASEERLVKRGGGGVRMPSLGAKKKSAEAAYRYEPDTIELFKDEPEVPEVTATSLSIVVPNLGGETVLYQELLLEAGATQKVLVRAKTSKKRRTP